MKRPVRSGVTFCWYHCTCPTIDVNSRDPVGTEPSAGQISGMPWIRNVFLAHCSFTSLAMAAMFGTPVGWPLASGHVDISETSGLKREFPPTAATEVLQALIWPFLASVGSSLESQVSTASCRQPIPPLALTYLAYASMASMFPWNSPGASDDPVSAITCTVMVSAVTPVSVASNVTPSHAALVADVVA